MNEARYWRHIVQAQPRSDHIGFVCGAELTFDARVHVSVGPVIGRVTDTAAVVLLEVDHPATVTCHACVVNETSPHGRVVSSATLQLPANSPRSFLLSDLHPGSRHVFVFSGVCRKDALARFATTRVLSGDEPSLRVVAVGGQALTGPPEGDNDVWDHLQDAVDAGKVDVVVHVGGQVRVARCGR